MSIESQEKLPSVSVETLELSSKTWEDLKEDILRIEKECFGETGLEEEDFTNIAHSPDGIVALLKKGQKILGYTIGGQDENEEKTITIYSTAITPEEQGMGYVESLVGSFESEARKRGYLFLTRYAAKENGYADKIQKNYTDRIVETSDNDSPSGPQRYFKIHL